MNETDKPQAETPDSSAPATPPAGSDTNSMPAPETPMLPPPEAVPPRKRRKRNATVDNPEPDKPAAATGSGAPIKPAANAKTATTPPPKSSRSALGLLALILAVIAVVLAAYDLVQTRELARSKSDRQAMEEQISATQSLIQTETQSLQEQLAGLQSADSEARKQLDELRDAYQQLSDERQNDVLAWRVAEIDYLLSSAGQHLALSGDITGTLRALEAADRRLQSLNDPGLLPVRQRLTAERDALEAVDAPDVSGMALALSSLLQSVDQLPVRDLQLARDAGEAEQSPDSSRWQQYLARVWQELKSLVTIRRNGADVKPLLDPEMEWFARETLRLKLEQARLALLRQQGELFDQLLLETANWLNQYFDPQTARVERLQAELQTLRDTPLATELPELGDALLALRQWTTRHLEQRGGNRPAERSTAPAARSANP